MTASWDAITWVRICAAASPMKTGSAGCILGTVAVQPSTTLNRSPASTWPASIVLVRTCNVWKCDHTLQLNILMAIRHLNNKFCLKHFFIRAFSFRAFWFKVWPTFGVIDHGSAGISYAENLGQSIAPDKVFKTYCGYFGPDQNLGH